MNPSEALEKLLPSYERYYNIKRDDVTSPFKAEAEFHSHSEQYVLIKAAKIAEMDTNEFVYFATTDNLNLEQFIEYDRIAWEAGISKVNPVEGHRNSDVTLIILCNSIEEEAAKQLKKSKHSKSYKFGIRGYSNYSVVALSLNDGKTTCNRFGKNFRKLVAGVLKSK